MVATSYITRAETKHTNLRVLRQCITLDQDYGAMFEHLAGELNAGTDGLSCLKMLHDGPKVIVNKIYAIDKLDHNANNDFPLAMTLLKSKQDQDKKLQEILKRPT